MIFKTKNLLIRKARSYKKDIELLLNLWNDSRVMKYVGFPHGLKINEEKVKKKIKEKGKNIFEQILIIQKKNAQTLIGECKLGLPDNEGISQTDVKLLPEFWHKGYGTEVKKGLVRYLFKNTDCIGVRGTPHKHNIASQKMQEKAGAIKVKEGIFHFPESMKAYTEDVPYYEYIVYRNKRK